MTAFGALLQRLAAAASAASALFRAGELNATAGMWELERAQECLTRAELWELADELDLLLEDCWIGVPDFAIRHLRDKLARAMDRLERETLQ